MENVNIIIVARIGRCIHEIMQKRVSDIIILEPYFICITTISNDFKSACTAEAAKNNERKAVPDH